MSQTLEHVRARVHEAGHRLDHVDDRELRLRLLHAPEEAREDFRLMCTWLVSAYLNPYQKADR